MTYRCFVGHPWADNLHFFAQQLAAALRRREIEPWLDQDEMLPGQHIFSRQHNGIIHESDVFLFVLAPATLGSANCLEELECALRNHRPVITLVVKPCETPEALRQSISVDFTNPVFFESAVDRLAAGIKRLGESQAIQRRLKSCDPEQRGEALQLLADTADASAFHAVKQCRRDERDDTVAQYLPGYFGRVQFPDDKVQEEALCILEELATSSGALTRRAARRVLEERRP